MTWLCLEQKIGNNFLLMEHSIQWQRFTKSEICEKCGKNFECGKCEKCGKCGKIFKKFKHNFNKYNKNYIYKLNIIKYNPLKYKLRI